MFTLITFSLMRVYPCVTLFMGLGMKKVKLIDFNVSKFFGFPHTRSDIYVASMLTKTGNRFYAAPEMLIGGGYEFITVLPERLILVM
jgi:serine/threonine protein kinase